MLKAIFIHLFFISTLLGSQLQDDQLEFQIKSCSGHFPKNSLGEIRDTDRFIVSNNPSGISFTYHGDSELFDDKFNREFSALKSEKSHGNQVTTLVQGLLYFSSFVNQADSLQQEDDKGFSYQKKRLEGSVFETFKSDTNTSISLKQLKEAEYLLSVSINEVTLFGMKEVPEKLEDWTCTLKLISK